MIIRLALEVESDFLLVLVVDLHDVAELDERLALELDAAFLAGPDFEATRTTCLHSNDNS